MQKGKENGLLGVILNASSTKRRIDRRAEDQWTRPTILPGQHNKTTRHLTRYPPQLSTRSPAH